MPETLERLKEALADRYTIQRELGRGGMATVYLAEDRKHHRPVALKVLRPELAAALGPDRFLREIELSARLTHPHILPLHDSGNADGFLYYVMPYVEGESLRDRLTREKQLPVDDALQISREVADALSYAHSHGVIHRDIKPENILLESGHAVVADFGIARAIDAAGGDRLTETGVAMGTPQYMSPEQAGGAGTWTGGPISTRSAVCCTRCWRGSRRSRGRRWRAWCGSTSRPSRRTSRTSGRRCRAGWCRRCSGRWRRPRRTGSTRWRSSGRRSRRGCRRPRPDGRLDHRGCGA
jgi:serine/threonine protein kinase